MSEPARKPNPKQDELSRLPIENILVIAPAGCGKTDALAARARTVVDRGEVAPPTKILALTYSNKAKRNLATRMRDLVGPSWRNRVWVTNFHGLATRVIQAHGNLVGISSDVLLPEKSWRSRRLRELGIDWRNSEPFEASLRRAKEGLATDSQVLEHLHHIGHDAAIAFEEGIRDEGRLDYDDLIRQASRLLDIPAVARLYRAHFAMVMVDEVQDLTLRQFNMVRAVGGDRVTYAGDPAQGIYSFAGAQPVEVFAAIRAMSPTIVEFNLSYRSCPAVLRAVNVLASELGSTQLECGAPEKWNDDGHVIVVERSDTEDEAVALLDIVRQVVRDKGASIGVVARRASRMDQLRNAASSHGLDFQDWSAPTHVPQVVELLKRFVRDVAGMDLPDHERLRQLEILCRAELQASDAEGHDEVATACDALREIVEQGGTLVDTVASCRAVQSVDEAVAPGLHLLTGHLGKGQEFDWVIVIGLEDGHVPDFRNDTGEELEEELRVLHVMVSRARYGLVVTCCRQTMTKVGWRPAVVSRWLAPLRAVATAVV